MKSSVFALGLSIAAASTVSVAKAETKDEALAALTPQDFAFCLSVDATAFLAASIESEVGIVITNVGNYQNNASGTVVVAANNFYGNGAGSEWKSNMQKPFRLTGGSCYNVAMMSKPTGPSGNAFTCAMTKGFATEAGVVFYGQISPVSGQTTTIAIGDADGRLSQQPLNGAPIVRISGGPTPTSCPY